MLETQNMQIKSYFNKSQDQAAGRIQSVPNFPRTSSSSFPQALHSGSAPVDPDRSLLGGMSSTGTSLSEVRLSHGILSVILMLLLVTNAK